MSYAYRTESSETYSWIAVILTALIGIILIVLGAGSATNPTLVIGIILLIVALASYLTTADRIRHRDYRAARTPLMLWGIVAIVFAALIGAVLMNLGGIFLFLSFGELLAGILFIVAHSGLHPPMVTQQPAVSYAERGSGQARTELKSETELIGVASLQCKDGADAGSTFKLGRGRSTIGRDEGSDIRLNDPTVSRTHAEIFYDGKQFTINDLGSLNGTYVDGTAVARGVPRKLRDGAQVKLGSEVLIFTAGQSTQLAQD